MDAGAGHRQDLRTWRSTAAALGCSACTLKLGSCCQARVLVLAQGLGTRPAFGVISLGSTLQGSGFSGLGGLHQQLCLPCAASACSPPCHKAAFGADTSETAAPTPCTPYGCMRYADPPVYCFRAGAAPKFDLAEQGEQPFLPLLACRGTALGVHVLPSLATQCPPTTTDHGVTNPALWAQVLTPQFILHSATPEP